MPQREAEEFDGERSGEKFVARQTPIPHAEASITLAAPRRGPTVTLPQDKASMGRSSHYTTVMSRMAHTARSITIKPPTAQAAANLGPVVTREDP